MSTTFGPVIDIADVKFYREPQGRLLEWAPEGFGTYVSAEDWWRIRGVLMIVNADKNTYKTQVDALRASNERLCKLLAECDEAMMWDLGGEPLPSLMIEARKKIKAALAGAAP